MTEEKKKSKNLATYAVIMILCVVILIIFAAMADGREQRFENQINEQAQTNMSIQDEIVRLKDDNYKLTKDKETLSAALKSAEAEADFYRAVVQVWDLYTRGDLSGAQACLTKISREELTPEETECLTALDGLLAQLPTPEATATPKE